MPAAIPLFGVIRSILVTSPEIVSTAFGSYILLYGVPDPQPPLPCHIMPGRGCASDDKVAVNNVTAATASAKPSFFILSHLLSSLLALFDRQSVAEQRLCHHETHSLYGHLTGSL